MTGIEALTNPEKDQGRLRRFIIAGEAESRDWILRRTVLFRQTQRVVVLGGQSSAATHKLGGTAGVNASGRGLPVSTIGIYLGLVPNEPSPGKSLSLPYLAKTHKKEAVPGEKPEDRFPPFLDKDAHKRAVLPGRVAGL